MPKIRKKAKLKKIDGSYPEKSGVLSKSIKKYEFVRKYS